MSKAKPFVISKWQVMQAYKFVIQERFISKLNRCTLGTTR